VARSFRHCAGGSETSCQPASSMQTDLRRCTMGSGRLCGVNRWASHAMFGRSGQSDSGRVEPLCLSTGRRPSTVRKHREMNPGASDAIEVLEPDDGGLLGE
jgi:hypothetical protein